MTIPKDKESLDEQISSLKKELNYEKRDKALLKAEFNKLREFLGKIKKDKINEGNFCMFLLNLNEIKVLKKMFYLARKIPERPKTASKKNSDLSGVIEGNNTSIVDKQNEGDSSKHRLKIQQLKEKIEEIEKLNKAQEDQIAKLKSKGLGETEYSSKLRKDLLK